MTNIDIKKFNVEDSIKPHRIWFIVGKRGTGKSTLMRDLLCRMKSYVDVPIAITPTEESIDFFEECMPSSCVHTEFKDSIIEGLIEAQRQQSKKKREIKSVLLVLDDMMYDKKILKSKAMRDIFMNGRHLKVTLVLTAQYLMDMGPDLRSQVDYCFALREPIITNKLRLWKFFFGGFENFEDFCVVFNACTSDNECLMIDNTIKTNVLSEMVCWYKANISIDKYMLGNRTIWGIHDRYYHTEEEMAELRKSYQPAATGGVKKKITTVSKRGVE